MLKDKNALLKISDAGVNFIRTYIFPEWKDLRIIDEELFCDIMDIAVHWELLMCDGDGVDIIGDYPNKARNEMADKFITEVSGDKAVDYDDLNRRLGLL